jgi:membrane-associated phospholipid phosphatase
VDNIACLSSARTPSGLPEADVLARESADAPAPDPAGAAVEDARLHAPTTVERGVGATVHTPANAVEASFVLAERAPARPARAPWWGELLAVAWLAFLYDVVTGLAPTREALAMAHGRSILSLERSLGVDPELALDRWLSAHHTLGAICSYYYDVAHFAVTLGLLGWLWWRRTDVYRPLRNALVAINVLGLLVFWLCPVAPPRMLAGSGFSDVVAASHTLGSWHTGSLAADADQFGAMPSLHLAWAAWCALVIWRLASRRWARVVAVSYPCSVALAVLSTGNHYMLDVLAGLATCAAAVALVWLVSRRPGRRLRPVSA